MKIATWNVNSIRSRLDRAVAWLAKQQPDVVCLQELKCTDADFPLEALRDAGYHAAVYGQKTYNGVAVLSRSKPSGIETGVGSGEDEQARLISVEIEGIRVMSAYVPNGSEVGSEKYAYKLEWLRELRETLEFYEDDEPLILCGDLNVARFDDEVGNPERWADTVLCHQDARDALERVRAWGFVDVFRKHHPDGGVFSWWDYRAGAFHRNDGLRIDHIFATEGLAAKCSAAEVDRDERKGSKPSDHAPVLAVFDI